MIRLQSSNASLTPIRDPDPLVTNDLMDGRDAFLMMAREKHYEFSTLRRAKFSSMAMLYELHTQGRDSFVYTCNACKTNMETHYHCSTCDVSRPCCCCCCCYAARVGQQSFAISLSVCVSVLNHISGTAGLIFTKRFVHSSVAVARSCCGGIATCYVLVVL